MSCPEALLRRTHGDHIAGGCFLASMRAPSGGEEARGVVSSCMRARVMALVASCLAAPGFGMLILTRLQLSQNLVVSPFQLVRIFSL